MATVKINNKQYPVKELDFGDMVHMEDMGFPVIESFRKQHVFSLAAAFTGIVADCDRERAEELCQQHVLGGGDIGDIVSAFTNAVSESGFFKKLLDSGQGEGKQKENDRKS